MKIENNNNVSTLGVSVRNGRVVVRWGDLLVTSKRIGIKIFTREDPENRPATNGKEGIIFASGDIIVDSI